MPCLPTPAGYFPAPPSLPGGFSFGSFSPPTVSAGLCCNIQVPPWGSFPIPPLPPFPATAIAAVVAVLAELDAVEAAIFDAVSVPCPIE